MTRRKSKMPRVERVEEKPRMLCFVYPFDRMKVGDSFLIPCKGSRSREARNARSAAGQFAKRYNERLGTSMKFSSEIEPGGLRIKREK